MEADQIMIEVLRRGAKKLASTAVQTEKENEPVSPEYAKQKIEKIFSHKTEGQKMGVRFQVKWEGYQIKTFERSQTILAQGGRKLLAKYLLELMESNNRKFVYLMRNEPRLGSLLKENKSKTA